MWFALGFLVALAGVILYGVRRSESRAVRAVAVLVAVVLVLPLALVVGYGVYVGTPRSGDKFAETRIEEAVTALADEIAVPQQGNGVLDGEQLALHTVERAADYEYGRGVWEARDVEIVVLGWSGTTGDRGGATVDVRIEAYVPYESGQLFGRSRSEGRAVRCWQLTVRYQDYHEGAGTDRIDCPDVPVDQVPVPAGAPTLGPAEQTTVLEVLREAPAIRGDLSPVDAEAFVQDVQDAWWNQHPGGLGVEARAQVEEGVLVLAVSVPARRECIIGVREPGSVPVLYTDESGDRLAPGGPGCQPARWQDGPGSLSVVAEPAPGTGAHQGPTPSPSRPWLLDEATTPSNEKLLLRTLGELSPDTDAEAARQAVAEAFPDYTVDAGREGDELVATVFGPTYRDCLVAVRTGGGEPVRFTDFLRISLEPGEIGCRPSLYWTDVTAH